VQRWVHVFWRPAVDKQFWLSISHVCSVYYALTALTATMLHYTLRCIVSGESTAMTMSNSAACVIIVVLVVTTTTDSSLSRPRTRHQHLTRPYSDQVGARTRHAADGVFATAQLRYVHQTSQSSRAQGSLQTYMKMTQVKQHSST
jgi:hypothetical protein